MDFLWPLLGGALGAAVINGIFSFYKLRRDADVEHEQWRRDQRQIEYSIFLEALWAYRTALTKAHISRTRGQAEIDEIEATNAELYLIYSRLSLIIPSQVIPATGRVFDASTELLAAYVKCIDAEAQPSGSDFDSALSTFRSRVTEFKLMARQDLGVANESKDQMKAFMKLENSKVADTKP